MTDDYTIDYELSDDDEYIHNKWDNSLESVLTVEPGEVVRFECRDALDGQITPGSTAEDFGNVSFDPVHPLTGPVAVEGAEPGDVLAVEFLDFEHKGWGYTGYMPGEMGYGLLPEDFEEGGLYIWDLGDDVAHFVNDIEVPLNLFPGIAGVAPAASGAHNTLPPRDTGGNMDVAQLTKGSTLYLPIEVEDALFSTGDCHAAQGDGEVCVTGIEAPMFVTARFDVLKDKSISQPELETAAISIGSEGPAYGTTGIDDNLMGAMKRAVRHMISHLESEHGLTRGEAYILCSAALDLKMSEVVGAPNWSVTAFLPNSIFPE
ncbi:acetamidase [Haloferax mediterranei ATCC 33500]|uniref:Acetamidase n=1 Tax=Haloferax mediterranei (strain ATCC 33500 / DSM 1411 / JCM 8866 / NBRC 14739 / NCIMB 2177 / R-4) TaxID=523841 RepID=I3R4U9_HALMT|nr:acetamidase/formamidase family protein [Haloferax mediterranei]AFK19259.1 formamidase [Haloferax mediterranei ATCC 33500]AHZ21382.1 acetamidase [Haloferax mediterranei ATCC 33500]EMA04553.1 formamidase [Haloferax mediterranei ATCC 33500]MDX5989361.1 acetamidase/formamidase family protein [Haloferax mediterranei ATCC 33500]QCQ75726.1 acetamidase [Haloferax mediterranei ATCC 33500]